MSVRVSLSLFLFALIHSGCFSAETADSPSAQEVTRASEANPNSLKPRKVTLESRLPKRFVILPSESLGESKESGEVKNHDSDLTHEKMVYFPPDLFDESFIIRPRAELRTGPGTQFPLNEQVLSNETKVLVFERLGVWRRVLAYETNVSGWVHHQTLAPTAPNENGIALSPSDLPNLVVLRRVTKVFLNPDFHPKKVDIPRGWVFNWLCRRNKKYLVWIKETNSVVWLSEEDVR